MAISNLTYSERLAVILADVEAELALAVVLVEAVAVEAVVGQDRPDVAVVADLTRPGAHADERGTASGEQLNRARHVIGSTTRTDGTGPTGASTKNTGSWSGVLRCWR